MEGTNDPFAKPWGWSTRLCCNETLQLERIFIVPGGYSSIHLHECKANMFIVSHGEMIVKLFGKDNESSVVVGAADSYVVDTNIKHQFVASQQVQGYEVYWPCPSGARLDPNDIVRFSDNGVDDTWVQQPTGITLCCECNKQFEPKDLVQVCVGSALRQMCRPCVNSTDTPPLGHMS